MGAWHRSAALSSPTPRSLTPFPLPLQVDFQSTILSRFDMIFILRDEFDVQKDKVLAKHILDLHVEGMSTVREPDPDEIDVQKLKRYIAYARAKCSPRLNEGAMESLQNYYVSIRQGLVEDDSRLEGQGKAPRAVPITVRQLEAVVRISESVAKMRLSDTATEDDVQLAIQLFTVSTLRAAKMGDIELEGAETGPEHTAEAVIRKRVAIGSSFMKSKLLGELNQQGIDRAVADRALGAMVRQGEFSEYNMGKGVKRLR